MQQNDSNIEAGATIINQQSIFLKSAGYIGACRPDEVPTGSIPEDKPDQETGYRIGCSLQTA